MLTPLFETLEIIIYENIHNYKNIHDKCNRPALMKKKILKCISPIYSL